MLKIVPLFKSPICKDQYSGDEKSHYQGVIPCDEKSPIIEELYPM